MSDLLNRMENRISQLENSLRDAVANIENLGGDASEQRRAICSNCCGTGWVSGGIASNPCTECVSFSVSRASREGLSVGTLQTCLNTLTDDVACVVGIRHGSQFQFQSVWVEGEDLILADVRDPA